MLNQSLCIHDLDARHPGLTRGLATAYHEAATVCLHRNNSSPTNLRIDRGRHHSATANWQCPDERTKRAWANTTDATEAGAYCVALAAIELTDGLVAVRRAETFTGADYYLSQKGAAPDDLEDIVRFEVSGIDTGNAPQAEARLRQKILQAVRGRSGLPALVAVVVFSPPRIVISDVEKE